MSTAQFVNPIEETKRFGWRDFLKRHPLFLGLKEPEIQKLLGVSEEREFEPGDVILKEGEVGDSLFLIGSGSVEIQLTAANGTEVTLATLKAREYFGEMAIIERRPRAATVKALTPSTLLQIGSQEFARLMQDYPGIKFQVLLKLSERLRQVNEQVLGTRMTDVDDKLKFLDSKLTSELKVVEASLKAAQALFEQTNMRVGEVIGSADRNRTHLIGGVSAVATVIAVAVTLFGWLGFEKFLDIEKLNAQLTQAKVDAEKLHALSENFTKLDNSAQQAIQVLVQDFLITELNAAVDRGSPPDAEHYYKEANLFGPGLLDRLSLLERIKQKLLSRGAEGRRDYTPLLTTILADAQGAEQFHAHLLLLVNMIQLEKPVPPFEEALSAFGQCVKQQRTSGLSRGDLNELEGYFSDENGPRRQRFEVFRKLIPVR